MGAGCYYISVVGVLAVLQFKIYINHQFLPIPMDQKQWVTPQRATLTRSRPEEAVLEVCKNDQVEGADYADYHRCADLACIGCDVSTTS